MTREEQIMNFVETEYKKLAFANPGGLTPEGRGYVVALGDVIRFVDKLPKTLEPQGLDEAAEEYAEQHSFHPCDYDVTPYDCFKAGAKWQAEQGVSWEDEIGWYDGLLLYSHDERQNLVGTDFNIGDKVVVQIRKK